MKNVTVARRYARALHAIAAEGNVMDDILTALSNVRLALDTTPELRNIFFNPTVRPESKQKLLSAVTSNKTVLKFVGLLAKRKRLDLIPVIHDVLSDMNDHTHKIVRPHIKTAIALSDDQKRSIEQQLSQSLGGKMMGRFDVAKELLGGVWIKIGDKVLDATLKGRLDDFRHVLLHSSN